MAAPWAQRAASFPMLTTAQLADAISATLHERLVSRGFTVNPQNIATCSAFARTCGIDIGPTCGDDSESEWLERHIEPAVAYILAEIDATTQQYGSVAAVYAPLPETSTQTLRTTLSGFIFRVSDRSSEPDMYNVHAHGAAWLDFSIE